MINITSNVYNNYLYIYKYSFTKSRVFYNNDDDLLAKVNQELECSKQKYTYFGIYAEKSLTIYLKE
jgi:hypothetical protein